MNRHPQSKGPMPLPARSQPTGPFQRGFFPFLLLLGLAGEFGSVSAGDSFSPNPTEASLTRVKTVNPRPDGSFGLKVEQPAEVLAYYRVSLFSENSGKLIFLEKDLGQTVVQGEKIAVIESGSNPTPETLLSPFDGVISARSYDPGSFVPSAAVVPGASAIVTVDRNDIVTVSAKIPDRYATFINRESEVAIEMNEFPGGGPLMARINRIAPSLSTSDRTLTLEIDLYNKGEAAYKDFMAASTLVGHQNLKGREPPQLPRGLTGGQGANLMPGRYGKVRVLIRPPQNALFLPGSAVIYRGGVPYVFRVTRGITEQIPVELDLDDGTSVHLWLLNPEGSQTRRREIELGEEYVISNQGDLESGFSVTSTSVAW